LAAPVFGRTFICQKKENQKMEDYKVKFFVPGGAGTVEEKLKAASESNARRYVLSRFPQARVVAVSVERTPKPVTSNRNK
jgi:hypothetical protein